MRLVDKNVLLYAANTLSEEEAKRLRTRALLAEPDLAAPARVVQELWHRATCATHLGRLSHNALRFLEPVLEMRSEAENHAIRQYRRGRNPKEPTFRSRRCMAHFSVDANEVHSCPPSPGPPGTPRCIPILVPSDSAPGAHVSIRVRLPGARADPESRQPLPLPAEAALGPDPFHPRLVEDVLGDERDIAASVPSQHRLPQSFGRSQHEYRMVHLVRTICRMIGLYEIRDRSQHGVVAYEPVSEPCDTGQIPPQDHGGIDRFQRRKVLRYAVDACYVPRTGGIG